MHLSGDRVQHEVMILRLAIDEILDLGPFLPAVDAADLEDGGRATRDYRTMLEREALSGHSF